MGDLTLQTFQGEIYWLNERDEIVDMYGRPVDPDTLDKSEPVPMMIVWSVYRNEGREYF